jgi:hypothetical protein
MHTSSTAKSKNGFLLFMPGEGTGVVVAIFVGGKIDRAGLSLGVKFAVTGVAVVVTVTMVGPEIVGGGMTDGVLRCRNGFVSEVREDRTGFVDPTISGGPVTWIGGSSNGDTISNPTSVSISIIITTRRVDYRQQ